MLRVGGRRWHHRCLKNCNFRRILWDGRRCTKSGSQCIFSHLNNRQRYMLFSKPEFSELGKTCHGNKYCILVAISSPRNGCNCFISLENLLYSSCRELRAKAVGGGLAATPIYRESWSRNWSSIIKAFDCVFFCDTIYLARTNPALQHRVINVNTVWNKSRGRGVCVCVWVGGKFVSSADEVWTWTPSTTHSHTLTHSHYFFYSNSVQSTSLQSKYACRRFVGYRPWSKNNSVWTTTRYGVFTQSRCHLSRVQGYVVLNNEGASQPTAVDWKEILRKITHIHYNEYICEFLVLK